MTSEKRFLPNTIRDGCGPNSKGADCASIYVCLMGERRDSFIGQYGYGKGS